MAICPTSPSIHRMVVGMNYSQMYQYLEEVPGSSSKGEIGQISEMTLQILDVLLSTANNSLNTQAVGLCIYWMMLSRRA